MQLYYLRDVLHALPLYAVLSIIQIVLTFGLAVVVPTIVRRFGKRTGYIGGGLIMVVGGLVVFLAPPTMVWLAFSGLVLCYVGLVLVNMLVWALEADTVEYGEWKTGVRAEGIIYALFSFTRKTGQAVGGALAAYALAIGGYVAGVETQSVEAEWGIRAAAGLLPAVAAGARRRSSCSSTRSPTSATARSSPRSRSAVAAGPSSSRASRPPRSPPAATRPTSTASRPTTRRRARSTDNPDNQPPTRKSPDPMKITKAEVIVTSPDRNFVTLKLTTDDGLTGLGDATLNGRELAVVELPQGPRRAVADRSRCEPHRGHLAVPLPQRLLAPRTGHDGRDRRRRHGALGHQGQGGRDAAVPAARRRLAHRPARLRACLGQVDRGALRQRARRTRSRATGPSASRPACPG